MDYNPTNDDITYFGKTNFRGREKVFGIRRDDRRRHMYIVGKTGTGKTTFLENIAINDLNKNEGFAYFDPHGDSVEKLLNHIPSHRINDVVYVNPHDTEYPIGFNVLEVKDPSQKNLVAAGLMSVFTKMWANVWSARMEYILNNTVLALVDTPGQTMMGIARMYADKKYRLQIIKNIKDPVVKSFWENEYANFNERYQTEAVAPIQNKVGQFLSSSMIRNIVAQPKSSIDFRDIMDNRKILLVNLSKGRIGEDASALLGAMMITKLQLAAMSRVDIPEEKRRDFYLYVDEFQNFATESFATILSEARKYKLNLTVAHQYIAQLKDPKSNQSPVRDAVFGNVGTIISFRVGAEDAEFLEKEFEPTFEQNDLVNLPKFNIYLKLMINGISSSPFSATTLPPIGEPTDNAEKVINVSRERYTEKKDVIEPKIARWLGIDLFSGTASIDEQPQQEKKEDTRSKKPNVKKDFKPERKRNGQEGSRQKQDIDKNKPESVSNQKVSPQKQETSSQKNQSEKPPVKEKPKKAKKDIWERVDKLQKQTTKQSAEQVMENLFSQLEKAELKPRDIKDSVENNNSKPSQQQNSTTNQSKSMKNDENKSKINLKPGQRVKFDK